MNALHHLLNTYQKGSPKHKNKGIDDDLIFVRKLRKIWNETMFYALQHYLYLNLTIYTKMSHLLYIFIFICYII